MLELIQSFFSTYEGSKNTQNLIEMLHDKMSPALEKDMTSLAEKVVADAVNIITNPMADSLIDGKCIEIRDFASFSLREAKPRFARNPRTGELVKTVTLRVRFILRRA